MADQQEAVSAAAEAAAEEDDDRSGNSSKRQSLDTKIRDFCRLQRELLELELLEDQEKGGDGNGGGDKKKKKRGAGGGCFGDEDQRIGSVVSSLRVSEVGIGLYGRTVATFADYGSDGAKNLAVHRLTPGDEVEIRSKNNKAGSGSENNDDASAAGGVVCQVTETSISVALFGKGGRGGKQQQQQQPSKKKNKGGSNNRNNNDDSSGDDVDFGDPPYSLVPRSSVQVHAKMVSALDELERYGGDHDVAGSVVRALFERKQEEDQEQEKRKRNKNGGEGKEENPPFNPNLDESQLEAVSFCLRQPSPHPVALIHGPPGTGKTTTVAELVLQAVRYRNYKVLVTAPSNVAVDTVLAKLVELQRQRQVGTGSGGKNRYRKLAMVRLGHPARLREDILPYSLEHQVQNAEETRLVADARRELQSYLNVLQGRRGGGSSSGRGGIRAPDRQLARQEIRHLRKEIRSREERVVGTLLREARVVLATCVGAASSVLLRQLRAERGQQFDLVIIDEAAQALEAACWIPALQASEKLVLAGDHCQLPPTIKSTRSSVQEGLKQTMFERLLGLYSDTATGGDGDSSIARMLQVQYRMNKSIANWASGAMYNGKLRSHHTVQDRTLAQLVASRQRPSDPEGERTRSGGVDGEDGSDPPVMLYIDTAGCAMHESLNESSLSRYNVGEAQLVVQHVEYLLSLGLGAKDIAVITPYSGQVQLLKTMLQERGDSSVVVETRTVDGFQGGEREAVVLSLVRSSSDSSNSSRKDGASIGFLRDDRRLNVAVTRSKRHCCVIGDSETLNTSPFVKELLEWMMEHGEHRSAMEYMDGATAGEATNHAPAHSNLMKETELQMQQFLDEAKAASRQPRTLKAPPAKSKQEEDERTKELVSKIQKFAETAVAGQELALSSELSRWDRKIVHEQAEKHGIGHRSDGVEGVDRHVTVFKPNAEDDNNDNNGSHAERDASTLDGTPQSEAPAEGHGTSGRVTDDEAEEEPEPTGSAFAALEIDDGVDDDGDDENEDEGTPAVPPPVMNSLLSDLAKERADRQRQQPKTDGGSKKPPAPKKKKKKGGQKLGGTKKAAEQKSDEGLDELDDMAFLDAQIEKVQTSHGRKVEGSGKGYRTVVNGILLAKPTPPEQKKDARASSSLKTKLQQKQNDRKAKPKKR